MTTLPEPIARFDAAQRRAISLLSEVINSLKEGMSEADVASLATDRAASHGFDRWYHPPEVRIGAATAATPTPIVGGPSRRRKLENGALIQIDVGPGNEDAYGDVGTTLLFGGGDEPEVVSVARECARGCVGYASRWKTLGEIFIFADAWAKNHRLTLANKRSVGHRVLLKDGALATGYPRSAHIATTLGRNQLHRLNPVRMQGMFAVRPLLVHGDAGGAFEEMFYIEDDVRVVLGRDSLKDIGTF